MLDVSEAISANCGYRVTEKIMRFIGTASIYASVAGAICRHQEHGFMLACDRWFGVTTAGVPFLATLVGAAVFCSNINSRVVLEKTAFLEVIQQFFSVSIHQCTTWVKRMRRNLALSSG